MACGVAVQGFGVACRGWLHVDDMICLLTILLLLN